MAPAENLEVYGSPPPMFSAKTLLKKINQKIKKSKNQKKKRRGGETEPPRHTPKNGQLMELGGNMKRRKFDGNN
jgi:hypothetical protein